MNKDINRRNFIKATVAIGIATVYALLEIGFAKNISSEEFQTIRPKKMATSQLGINGDDVVFFPELSFVFKENTDALKNVFFPALSFRLSLINKEWGDDFIHLVQFNEDP